MNSAVRMLVRAAVLVLAALALYRYAWLPYRANRELFIANAQLDQALKYEGSDPSRMAILARDNLARLQSVERACRTNVEYEMLYAENARLLRRFDEAFAHYDAALRIDHRPEIYFHRGMARLQTGDVDKAFDDLVLAVKFRPQLNDDISGSLHKRIAKAAGISKK